MKDYKKLIGINLKRIRKEKGFTQKNLADRLGVKNTSISNWETGVASIPIETLVIICDIFGVNLSAMSEEEPSEEKEKEPGEDAELERDLIRLFRTLSEDDQRYLMITVRALAERKRGNDA